MGKFNEWMRYKIRRVDIQVSIFVAVIVLISSLSVSYIFYTITYQDMIASLTDRVMTIHKYIEQELDSNSFYTINSKEDMNRECYKKAKAYMEHMRKVTDMMYLYTAKATPDGKFIYIIDGLDESEDFRYPGDEIEPEIHADMRRALSGEIVLPRDIKQTDWGKIFITYFPFHDSTGKVIGVLGIEIQAEKQYDTYRMLRLATPICIIIISLISIAFSLMFFKRISNPTYQDLINTDHLTELKNRNSFEVDLHNMLSMNYKKGMGFVVMDLDNLKQVNDILGHEAGDLYIRRAAKSLRSTSLKGYIAYRTGGDEFAVILPKVTLEILEKYVADVKSAFEKVKDECSLTTSLSIGFALYDETCDQDIRDTYKRADIDMYRQKKSHREWYLERRKREP